MKNIIIASTSTLHGGEYLDYLLPELQSFFSNVKELLFIPYARPSGISHDDYTKKVSEAFTKINISVKGIHEFENPIEALEKAQGIFTGGGNTFLLVSQLYKNNVIDTLEKVVKSHIETIIFRASSLESFLILLVAREATLSFKPTASILDSYTCSRTSTHSSFFTLVFKAVLDIN